MKFLKWVLIAAGTAVLLFAGALAFIAATFDPNQYKGQVAGLVREKTQRTLTIEGDIRLMLFPKLGVHLGKIRLSEFNSEKDFSSFLFTIFCNLLRRNYRDTRARATPSTSTRIVPVPSRESWRTRATTPTR